MRKQNIKKPQQSLFFPSIAILLITFIAYIPALNAGFIWDDDVMLIGNPTIKTGNGLLRIWSGDTPDYFPLVSTTFWLEWRLWGLNAVGYHFTNILLHALSAVLFWRLLKMMNIPAAFLAALVFAVHPVNVESVAWITERKNTLPMVFYFLSIIFYLKYSDKNRPKHYILSLAMFLLAMLSKTSVAMLPVILLMLAWWRQGGVKLKTFIRTIPFFILAAVLSLVTIWFQYHHSIKNEIIRTDGFISRLVIAACAVWFYLYKAVIPYNLIFVYPRWNIDPYSVVSWLPLIALIVVFILLWLYRKSWSRPFLFAFGYYVITLFPVLGFFDIFFMKYSFVADHWQYVSIPAVIAVAISLGQTACIRLQLTNRVKIIISLVLVGILSTLTLQQSKIYRNFDAVWHDTIKKNPECWMAHYNLGMNCWAQRSKPGKVSEAAAYLSRTLELNPFYGPAYNSLAVVFSQKNSQKAQELFEKGIKADPNYAIIYHNYAVFLNNRGKHDAAEKNIRKTLQLDPNYPKAHHLFGFILFNQSNFHQAIEHYSQSLRIDGPRPETYFGLGLSFASITQFKQAEVNFRKALQLNPDWPEALNLLAIQLICQRKEKPDNVAEALNLAQRSCKMTDYNQPDILSGLSLAYAAAGKFDNAVDIASKAVRLAEKKNDLNLAEVIRNRLEKYRLNQMPDF